MNDEKTIIDLKFGLSQLSGNRDLLVKLLMKFHSQYVDLADKLDTLIADGDVTAAKSLIHTVKGVSGNLGLKALHIAAKYIETTIAVESDRRSALAEFKSVFTKTLAEIATLDQQSSAVEPAQQDGLSELKDCLQRNEYISPDKLNNYLNQSEFAESTKSEITEAIEELDYPKALTLLASN